MARRTQKQVQPVERDWPTEGGTYLRDPQTGELTKQPPEVVKPEAETGTKQDEA